MIQNSNKYSENMVSYSLTKGELPGGMELRPNGEIYGVPTETGEFEFTVRMGKQHQRLPRQHGDLYADCKGKYGPPM